MGDINHIGDLTPDPRNARQHNPRNVGMVEKALREVGAGRSIVIDENGKILAGNATIEAAAIAGIENVQVIKADGNTIIAVQRDDLTEEQKRKLALYDNRAAELADWDPEVIAAIALDDDGTLDDVFTGDELERVVSAIPDDSTWADAFGGLPDGDRAPFQQMKFTLHDEQVAQIKRAMDVSKGMGDFDSQNENSNGNALARVCEVFVTDYGQS